MHVEKFKIGEMNALLKHDLRRPEDKEVRRSNENIDPERTQNNTAFIDRVSTENGIYGIKTLKKFAKEEEIIYRKGQDGGFRKDTVTMCSVCVTVPDQTAVPEESRLTEQEQEEFITQAHQFLTQRYGVRQGKNILCSVVHRDEKSLHLHFDFIPIVEDKLNGELKLSAKDLVTKTELKNLHKDFNETLTNYFGRDVGYLTLENQRHHLELKEYKKAQREVERLEERSVLLASETESLQQEMLHAQKELEKQQKQIERNQAKIKQDDKTLEENIKKLQKADELIQKVGQTLEDADKLDRYLARYEPLKQTDKKVVIDRKLWNQINATYPLLTKLQKMLTEIKRAFTEIIEWFRNIKEERLQKKLQEANEEVLKLKKENTRLKRYEIEHNNLVEAAKRDQSFDRILKQKSEELIQHREEELENVLHL